MMYKYTVMQHHFNTSLVASEADIFSMVFGEFQLTFPFLERHNVEVDEVQVECRWILCLCHWIGNCEKALHCA